MTDAVAFADVVQLCGCAVIACAVLLAIRSLDRGGLGTAVSAAISVGFALAAVMLAIPVIHTLREIAADLPDVPHAAFVFRAAGIGLTVQLSADTARDCGEERIAGYVEWIGRVVLLTLSLPLCCDLLDLAERLLRL